METETVPSPVTPVSTANMDRHAEARERMRQFKAESVSQPKRVFEVSEDDLDPTKPLKMLPQK